MLYNMKRPRRPVIAKVGVASSKLVSCFINSMTYVCFRAYLESSESMDSMDDGDDCFLKVIIFKDGITEGLEVGHEILLKL